MSVRMIGCLVLILVVCATVVESKHINHNNKHGKHQNLHSKKHLHEFTSSLVDNLEADLIIAQSRQHLEEDRGSPKDTPFVHRSVCDHMEFCNADGYRGQTASQKLTAMKSAFGRSDSSGSGIAVLGILDTDADVDGIKANIAKFALGIVTHFVPTSDVRTTFGVGKQWKDLDQVKLSGDQLEGTPLKGVDTLSASKRAKLPATPPLRHKVIHSVGVVGTVKLEIEENVHNKYTGMLKHGFDHGIVRFSSAKPISRGSRPLLFGDPTPAHVGPGLGLKAFVNGKDSENLVAMWSLDGQLGQWNFFEHEFTTMVPSTEDLILQFVAEKFTDASLCPTHIGTLGFARHKQDGTVETSPVAPYALVFVPTETVKNFMQATIKSSGKAEVDGQTVDICAKADECGDILESLTGITQNTALFEVYALELPAAHSAWSGSGPKAETFDKSKGVKLGKLILTEPLQISKFGDNVVFFKHQLFEDIVIHKLCDYSEAHNLVRYLEFTNDVVTRSRPTCGETASKEEVSHKNFVCRTYTRAKSDRGHTAGWTDCKTRFEQAFSDYKLESECPADPRENLPEPA